MFDKNSVYGVVKRAWENNLFEMHAFNPRDYVTDNYRRIDDKSFGSDHGMVMMIEPLEKTLVAAVNNHHQLGHQPKIIYLSPQGQPFTQDLVTQLGQEKGLVFVCGRYEGVDERFIERNVDLELSIGDFVVSGGELPVQLVIDALVRQIPGALNKNESFLNDSFMNGLLDYPHYAKPRDFQGSKVPEVLLSGNHKLIKKWRLQQSLLRTYQRRPDLLNNRSLSQEESRLLAEILENDSRNKIKKEIK